MESSSHPGPASPGGKSRIPPVNGVGKPCAGEPHARIDGRELETEHESTKATEMNHPRETSGTDGSDTYSRPLPPRQLPTLHLASACEDEDLDGVDQGGGPVGA